MFKVKASYTSTLETEMTEEQTQEYNTATERSTVITYLHFWFICFLYYSYSLIQARYGGPPGAYSPSEDGATTFGEWAANVDTLPVPIDYQLDAIGNIIPSSWTTPDGSSISDVSLFCDITLLDWLINTQIWAEAEIVYYNTLPAPTLITDNMADYEVDFHILPYSETGEKGDPMRWTNFTMIGSGASTYCSQILMGIPNKFLFS